MTQLAYSPPRLDRIAPVRVRKHRLADIAVAGEALEDGIDAAALIAQFGSPLFVVSEAALRNQYRSFRDTFTTPGIDTVVAYSYKTNYLPAVCAILDQEGALAEVVSGMEYSLARALGVPGERIVFNGPYKRPEELQRAIAEGALINIDGFDEIAAMREAAGAIGRAARVGLRINFRTGPTSWTKFGFNAESGDAARALELVRDAGDALDLQGFHNHSGTFQIDPKVYGQAVTVLAGVAKEARELGLKPRFIDLGGGYPSSNRLKPEFDIAGGTQLRGNFLAPYAEAIMARLNRYKELFGGRPTLMLEPGRALIDAPVRLLCTVVSTKEIPGHGAAAIIDVGVNVLPTAYWYDHEVEAVRKDAEDPRGETKPVSIYGPMCMQIDVVRERVLMPPLRPGMPLVIQNVGAYCLTQSMQFIQTRPAVALLGPDGPELIRRREEWHHLFRLDSVPERLAHPDCEI
jgi:diaminopimelate decarboxylase